MRNCQLDCVSPLSSAITAATPLSRLFAVVFVCFAALCVSQPSLGATPGSQAVRSELARQDAWLGQGENGDRWRRFLKNESLRAQLSASSSNVDIAMVDQIIARYQAEEVAEELTPLLAVRQALADWRRQLRVQKASSPAETALALQGGFVEVLPEEVAAARWQARADLDSLEQWLVTRTTDAAAWRAYFDFDALRDQLAEPEDDRASRVDLVGLQKSYKRFTWGEAGLEFDPVQRVATSLRKLIDLATFRRVPKQAPFHDALLTQVAKYLDRDPTANDPRVSYEVERRFDLIAGLEQSPELVDAMRQTYGRSNLYLTVATPLINRFLQRPVQDQRPIRDSLLGTRICGTGNTRGTITAQTLPSDAGAKLLLSFNGNIQSRTTGYNGPVAIYSSGSTDFLATKTIRLTDDSFRVMPAAADAQTQTRTRGIRKQGGNFGRRIVESIARKRVAEAKPQANRLASDKAEQQVSAEFNEQVEDEVREARQQYDNLLRKPLRRRAASPRWVQMRTDHSALHAEALLADRSQLSAPDMPPPDMPLAVQGSGRALSVRVHQSLANNIASVYLAGATVEQTEVDARPKFDVKMPEALEKRLKGSSSPAAVTEQEAADFKPWSLRFRSVRPVSFAFDEQSVQVIVHGAKIKVGDRDFVGWDILFRYVVARVDGKLALALDGPVDARPSLLDPAEGGSVRREQIPIRSILRKELNRMSARGKGAPPLIELPTIDLTKQGKQGLLSLEELTSDEGWLSLAWELF